MLAEATTRVNRLRARIAAECERERQAIYGAIADYEAEANLSRPDAPDT